MATRQIFIDDLDGTEEGVETVEFGLGGTNYQIDLGKANQERLQVFLDEFIAVAAVIGRDGTPRKRAPRPRTVNRKAEAGREIDEAVAELPKTADLPPFDIKIARAWLRENNHDVPARGKLRAEVVMPYLESEAFKEWQSEQAE